VTPWALVAGLSSPQALPVGRCLTLPCPTVTMLASKPQRPKSKNKRAAAGKKRRSGSSTTAVQLAEAVRKQQRVAFLGPVDDDEASAVAAEVPERIETVLVRDGTPLLPTPLDKAGDVLRELGVVRINSVLQADRCRLIRERILELSEEDEQRIKLGVDSEDKRFVPGTRLRFGDAVCLPMDGTAGFGTWTRNDVLLPLEDNLVAEALRVASSTLAGVLAAGAVSLPGDAASGLELVELAALVSRSGAQHQMLHADFRRDADFATIAALGGKPLPPPCLKAPPSPNDKEWPPPAALKEGLDEGADEMADIWAMLEGDAAAKEGDSTAAAAEEPIATSANAFEQMPPRLVTFIYLQDVPTVEHGATVFLPGTANAADHGRHLCGKEDAQSRPGTALAMGLLRLTDILPEGREVDAAEKAAEEAAPTAVIATLRAGDAVVFDASVLHFGSANTVANNERVVLYFGVARDGTAAVYDGGVKFSSATPSDARRPVGLHHCCADV